MKKFNVLYIVIMILMISCSENEEMVQIEQPPSSVRSLITYAGDTDGVSVLIFNRNSDSYYYKDKIGGTWDSNNRTIMELTLGKYKFLYYKSAGLYTDILPATPGATTKLEDIKFVAKEDPANPGYLLPVDEIWLPATPEMADSVYTIVGNDTIQNTLKRAVSQIELHLKRASNSQSPFAPFPFTDSQNVMQHIEAITLDISGVGETISYAGSQGNGNTFYELTSPKEITTQGFAFFEGPLVFPSEESVDNATVEITLIPKTGSILEGLNLSTTINGKLERNTKLSLTVWLNATYNIIDVNVDTTAITSENDSDKGIWE